MPMEPVDTCLAAWNADFMNAKILLAVLAMASLCGVAGRSAGGEPFAFAGFSLDTNIAALLDQYPKSSHDLSPRTAVRTRPSQDDPHGWIREFIRARCSGSYVLRLTPGESHDHVYYVQADVLDGVTARLRVSFEAPLDLVTPHPPQNNEVRHPPCRNALTPLSAKYGKPRALAPRTEEALEFREYVWADSTETMTLECGRYVGRRVEFADAVTFEKAGAR